MKRTKTVLTMITIFYLMLYILPLGIRPLIVSRELRHAEVAREMINSGDFIVPHLNGLTSFERPVLGYWLNAASIMIFGETPFAAHLPMALATGFTALVIYIFTAQFTNKRTATLALVSFLTSLAIFIAGSFAIPETIFTLMLTTAMAFLFYAYKHNTLSRKICGLILAGAFIGLAFLSQGTPALVIPFTAVALFLLWEKRLGDITNLILLPALAACIVILPWAVALHLHTADFWGYLAARDSFQTSITSAAEPKQSLWSFLPIIVLGTLPWSALVPAAVSGLVSSSPKTSFIRFATCWAIATAIFISVFPEYNEAHNILSGIPPLIILASLGLTEYFNRPQRQLFRAGLLTLCAILVASGIFIILAPESFLSHFEDGISTENLKLLVWTLLLLYAGLLLIASLTSDSFRASVTLIAISPVLLMLAVSVLANLCTNENSPHLILNCPKAQSGPLSFPKQANATKCHHIAQR